ncbi:hypothetical protein OIU84_020479 [Salix udensis]|uniref:Uncharacterized protein n=1 Tax=Salix udensis TaxID=889485 RepID=A0AAD6PFV3_9ROSI|nr:hypothetical protein OIU84_020479 [Salix udensis]
MSEEQMNFLGVVQMAFQLFSLYTPIFELCKIGKPDESSLNLDSYEGSRDLTSFVHACLVCLQQSDYSRSRGVNSPRLLLHHHQMHNDYLEWGPSHGGCMILVKSHAQSTYSYKYGNQMSLYHIENG